VEGEKMKVKADQPGQTSLIIERGGARPGAGRKKSKYEIRKASVALDPNVWKVIDDLREKTGKTQSDILRELIKINKGDD
jgi:hypothetical protein